MRFKMAAKMVPTRQSKWRHNKHNNSGMLFGFNTCIKDFIFNTYNLPTAMVYIILLVYFKYIEYLGIYF